MSSEWLNLIGSNTRSDVDEKGNDFYNNSYKWKRINEGRAPHEFAADNQRINATFKK